MQEDGGRIRKKGLCKIMRDFDIEVVTEIKVNYELSMLACKI